MAQHKLWFGALEGALEHETSAPPEDVSGATLVTTSSLAESGDLVALAPGSPVTAGDAETQARLQAALAGGDTLVVPKQVFSGGSRDGGKSRTIRETCARSSTNSMAGSLARFRRQKGRVSTTFATLSPRFTNAPSKIRKRSATSWENCRHSASPEKTAPTPEMFASRACRRGRW